MQRGGSCVRIRMSEQIASKDYDAVPPKTARLSRIKRPKEVPRNLFPGAFFCTHFQRNWPDFGVFPLIPAPFGIFPVGGGGIGGTPKMVGQTTVLCGTLTISERNSPSAGRGIFLKKCSRYEPISRLLSFYV